MFTTNADLTTSATSFACISRVNIDNRDTCFEGFILDKLLKLSKSPRVDNLSLFFGKFDAISDVCQVFKDNHITGLAARDNSLAVDVVLVCHPASFFAAKLFQSAFGRFRAFGLKSLAKFSIVFSGMHNLLARKPLSFGCSSDIVKPSVNSNGIATRTDRNFLFENNVDIKSPFVLAIRQSSRFWFLPFEQTSLEIAKSKFDVLSARMGRNADFFFRLDKRKRPLVIGDRTRLESLWWLLPFGRFGNAGDGSYYKIGGQFILGFKLVVAKVLKFHLVGSPLLLRNRQNIIAAISESSKRFMQEWDCFLVGFKFAFNCFN